jgi:nicotinamide N-methyltransferase
MAALTARIYLSGEENEEPEDYLSAALGVIFPDDVTNQHGDTDQSLKYVSPHLPKPLHLDLADPEGDADRRLFSHHLWNSSLLLAELIEQDTLGIQQADKQTSLAAGANFNVKDLATLELGAGSALPSMMAGLLGAKRVTVTDYPAPAVLKTLRANITRNIKPELSPPDMSTASDVTVEGHSWGELEEEAFSVAHAGQYDRLLVADCLWMPWQHENLQRSIAHFLKPGGDSRAWVVAGFHTGREKMKGFFEEEGLRKVGLCVERIWERDCDGLEREWSWDGEEGLSMRKRWLAIAVLKRL